MDFALAPEDTVRGILRVRQEEGWICGQGTSDERCTPISEIVTNANTIHPPPSFYSDTFEVVAEAKVGEVTRSVEAVVNRSDPGKPVLLSWQVR